MLSVPLDTKIDHFGVGLPGQSLEETKSKPGETATKINNKRAYRINARRVFLLVEESAK